MWYVRLTRLLSSAMILVFCASGCRVALVGYDDSATSDSSTLTTSPAAPVVIGSGLIKSINNQEEGSNPTPAFTLGGWTYFTSYAPQYGIELWKTDGTDANTQLVKDINPGSASSAPADFLVAGATVYFLATTPNEGTELWKTDGTAAGTVLVKDVLPGPDNGVANSANGRWMMFNSELYFPGYNAPASTATLWKTDGTTAGTVELRSDVNWIAILGEVSGSLLFRGSTAATGSELWKTDGTTVGTVLVEDIRSGSSDGTYADSSGTIVGAGKLHFIASDGSGFKYWVSDGTAVGTVLYSSLSPNGFRVLGSDVLVSASGGLYKADGSAPPTLLHAAQPRFFSTQSIFNLAGQLLFYYAPDASGLGVYVTDGTAGGTAKLIDLDETSTSTFSDYPLLGAVGSGAIFAAKTAAAGWELYFSDGSAPVLLADANPGAADGVHYWTAQPRNLNIGTLLYRATTAAEGSELWKTDGTPAGTTLVKDIFSTPASGSAPSNLFAGPGRIYFSANDGTTGNELWSSDGTSAGTTLLKNLNTKGSGSAPGKLTVVGSELFFTANDGIHGEELWKTDGTAAGTVLVKDAEIGSSSSYPEDLVELNGSLYYLASNGVDATTLWKTDGTEAGTQILTPGLPTLGALWMSGLIRFGTELFFISSDTGVGIELFKSDGTTAGTSRVTDIRPGSLDSFDYDVNYHINGSQLLFTRYLGNWEPWITDGTGGGTMSLSATSAQYAYGFASVGPITYFGASDASGVNFELWKTDGTPAGTVQVAEIHASASSDPEPLGGIGTSLLFTATDGATGTELWRSDGTAGGTQQVKDIQSGASSSSISDFVPLGTSAVFFANDGTNGKELWVTDGTTPGTQLLKDIYPGATGSSPSGATLIGGYVYFSADDGTHGAELWRTDGTLAGTQLIADANSGAGSSSPDNLRAIGSKLFFFADDGLTGKEPWVIDIP